MFATSRRRWRARRSILARRRNESPRTGERDVGTVVGGCGCLAARVEGNGGTKVRTKGQCDEVPTHVACLTEYGRGAAAAITRMMVKPRKVVLANFIGRYLRRFSRCTEAETSLARVGGSHNSRNLVLSVAREDFERTFQQDSWNTRTGVPLVVSTAVDPGPPFREYMFHDTASLVIWSTDPAIVLAMALWPAKAYSDAAQNDSNHGVISRQLTVMLRFCRTFGAV